MTRRLWRQTAVAMIWVLGLLSLSTPPALADRAGVVATLPYTSTLTSTIWDGQNAYIFGGMNGLYSYTGIAYSDRVVRFDPATKTSSFMQARMPTERADTAAVWTGQYAYIFGGEYCYYYKPIGGDNGYFEYKCRPTHDIVRYDPATDTATRMLAQVPEGTTRGLSAIWDGSFIYLFGGCCSGGQSSRQILRYEPQADQMMTMAASLPTRRFGTSAVWDGQNAYVFGGYNGPVQYQFGCCPVQSEYLSTCCTRVVKYDPATDVVTEVDAAIPSRLGLNRTRTTAVWDGTHAYIFGGGDGFECCGTTFADQAYYRDIVRFDPATHLIESMTALLPSGTRAASSVWDGTHAYVFGGCSDRGCTSEIVKYVLVPGPPQNFRVDPVNKQMILRWDPPAANSYSLKFPVTKFRIYKGSQPGILGLWAEVSSDTFSKADTSCVFITRCYYAISAKNALGEGERSQEVAGLGSREVL